MFITVLKIVLFTQVHIVSVLMHLYMSIHMIVTTLLTATDMDPMTSTSISAITRTNARIHLVEFVILSHVIHYATEVGY